MKAKQTSKEGRAKLVELILYVGDKCALHEHYGVLKLNKILFYSDFTAYRSLGKAITGVEYRKYEHGPAPACMAPLKKEMLEKNIATEYHRSLPDLNGAGEERSEKRLLPKRAANLDVFTAAEIAIVDRVIEKLAPCTGQEVSRLSHEHPGWRLVGMEETISYASELVPHVQQPLSTKVRSWATRVAKRHESERAKAAS